MDKQHCEACDWFVETKDGGRCVMWGIIRNAIDENCEKFAPTEEEEEGIGYQVMKGNRI